MTFIIESLFRNIVQKQGYPYFSTFLNGEIDNINFNRNLRFAVLKLSNFGAISKNPKEVPNFEKFRIFCRFPNFKKSKESAKLGIFKNKYIILTKSSECNYEHAFLRLFGSAPKFEIYSILKPTDFGCRLY